MVAIGERVVGSERNPRNLRYYHNTATHIVLPNLHALSRISPSLVFTYSKLTGIIWPSIPPVPHEG